MSFLIRTEPKDQRSVTQRKKVKMKSCLIFVAVSILVSFAESRLEPTKLVSGSTYKLQNQHDGRFLTSTSAGQFSRTEYSGNPSQKFLFTLVEGNNVWTLTPTDNPNQQLNKYKVTYVGHGKYQFMNLGTGMCIKGAGGQEGRCIKDEPTVRWFVDNATAN